MPKSGDQKLKLLYLEQYLLSNTDEEHPVTMEQILSHLDEMGITAERKAIYNDIEALRTAGLDIVHTSGKEGGYAVINRLFEVPELKLLVDAVQSSRFITERKSRKLISKLEKLAGVSEASQLERQVFVSGRVKTMNESIYYAVDRIHEAIADKKQLNFRYFDCNVRGEKVLRHDGATYRVSPLSLAWVEENYYLLGVDETSGEIRHYRVDKMTDVRKSGTPRSRRQDSFDAGAYTAKLFGMFGGEESLVVLRCADRLAGIIFDRFGYDLSTRPHTDGTFSVSVPVIVSSHFFTWLMNFPGEIEIESPASARKGYCEMVRRIAAALPETESET